MSPALLVAAALATAPNAELLDFTAEWCGPCQTMRPVVEQLRREGYPVRQIDVDQQRALASRFGITGMPTFVLVVNGKEVERKVGACSEGHLRQMLAKIPSAPDASQAAEQPKRKGWLRLFGDEKKSESVEPPSFDTGDRGSVELRGQSPPEPEPSTSLVAPSAAQDPIQTAVRIRVKDERGVDYGSGTLIGFQNGKGLALTCWHIFRDFGNDAKVEVDLFPQGPDGPPQTVSGRLIKANEDADVAVIGVVGCPPMPVSPIAATSHFPKEGDCVFSVGCDGGKAPTRLQHRVTRLNPYQGPGTTECTGMPVSGRSGGGLFDANGRVIGVCFAADREDERGVYVGSEEIHQLLQTANYTSLIPPPTADRALADRRSNSFDSTERATSPSDPSTALPSENVSVNQETPSDENPPAVSPPMETPEQSAEIPETLIANLGGDIEATIILHRRDKPNAPSQVYVIPKVSNRFRRYLNGEVDPPTVETGLRISGKEVSADTRKQLARAERESRGELTLVPASNGRSVALLARVFDNHR